MKKPFEVGKEYQYTEIEKRLEKELLLEHGDEIEEDFMKEYGNEICGENAIHISAWHNDYWFILTGSTVNGYVYKCVYGE